VEWSGFDNAKLNRMDCSKKTTYLR